MDSEMISQLGHPHSFKMNDKKNKETSDNFSPERRSSTSYEDNYEYNNIKPTSSFSTPSIPQPISSQRNKSPHYSSSIDPAERVQFLKEMEQTREELAEFRRNMAGLLKQMDGISVDLEKSKDRVSEIEQDITATQEFNVNLQVLLERAVKTQKESDVFATQAIRNMYSDLASVVYENNQLQGRLASIEHQQHNQKGSVHDIVKRMYEYTQMLEQAQGTIHMLQEPRLVKLQMSSSSSISSGSTFDSRRNSMISLYDEEYENDSAISTNRKETQITSPKKGIGEGYVQSPPLGPQKQHQSPLSPKALKPQQGLKMLFDSHGGGSGLGSLTKK